eukprot:2088968-Pyramimonas_sp.AAC.1
MSASCFLIVDLPAIAPGEVLAAAKSLPKRLRWDGMPFIPAAAAAAGPPVCRAGCRSSWRGCATPSRRASSPP